MEKLLKWPLGKSPNDKEMELYMFYGIDESDIIKIFSKSCFIIMGIFFLMVIGMEIVGKNGVWLSYRALEFLIYGVFALGFYKVIILLNQLVGEMRFFRHHYILKDKEK